MNKYTTPQFANSALITIDTQNDFTLENAPAVIAGTQDIIPNMARLLAAYRQKGLLIVHVIRLYLGDGSNVDLCRKQAIEEGNEMVAPETNGAELVEELKTDSSIKLNPNELLSGHFQKIDENEYVMYKPRWGAFFKTRLEEFLLEKGCNTLVFCGCNFPNCPRTSIYQASERDFRVALVTDAISQLYPKGEDEMDNIAVSLLTTSEIEQFLT